MATEPPVAAFTPEQATEPASPLQHETAILNPAEDAIEDGIEAVHQHFAPGAGELEEEIIDDEDYTTTLHASSIEEMDDLDEEETLEGAADLGTMIREMSIDEITSSGNSASKRKTTSKSSKKRTPSTTAPTSTKKSSMSPQPKMSPRTKTT